MTVADIDAISSVIDGQKVTPTGDSLPVVDPTTGHLLGSYRANTITELDEAFAAASRAFKSWRRSTPATRQSLLLALATSIEEHADELLDAEVAQTGKPRAVTRTLEILRVADQLRFFAGAARVMTGSPQAEYVEGFSSTIRREPIGVIAQITPWNYPLMMAVWKIAPALAAGNTVVLKPAETTPVTTVMLAELAASIFPPGVLNVVLGGREIGKAMSEHPAVDMVAITGSVRAGSEVMQSAAATSTNVHLELGGKAPAVVFADADLDAAAAGIASAGFFNAGQDCTAATRVIVEESVRGELTARLVEQAARLRPGMPDDSGTFLGPLNSKAQYDRVQSVLDRLPEHVTVACGGKLSSEGYFAEPTVLTNVRQDDEVVQSELFAPILTVQGFTDTDEALALANGVDYALASSLWTSDHGRATALAGDLDFGTVWVNCHQVLPAEAPHGGFKRSGFGKDLSIYGLEDYTRIKHVMSSHTS
ncbi:aminobutyraldehyde dehydrogenase [Saccharopolyspora pogona]|uniref:aminobutyraldehyde dehydrogenase n=1 Tax=Saccharopolyspora pogona TaxID=333966 RepID=UPI001681F23B|nr:aminobutyraldehyde dehydrogenase [Saccharopolyspora pogona]